MLIKCLKQGIKNRNSVLNRVGKSAIFVLNRVRLWGAAPHLPTQGYVEYPPGIATHKFSDFYFGGARSKGFATLRNVSKLQFFDKIGQAKSVGFRLYLAIWRSESRISSRYLEIISISLIYSLTFSTKKELLFWPSRGLNRLTCATHQIRGDSKLRD